jgi:hypothetical protein
MDLERQVTKLLDRQEILDLGVTYCRALDRLDATLLRSVYFDDAEESRGFYEGGPDGFVKFAMNVLKSHEANQHMLGQCAIDLEGDVAYGELYFQAFHRTREKGEDRDFWVGGRYIDRYEKRNGIWKIAYRSELHDWVSNRPAAEGYFFITNSKALKGARGSADLVNQREKFAGKQHG